MHDRWDREKYSNRSVEDLKERYYNICNTLTKVSWRKCTWRLQVKYGILKIIWTASSEKVTLNKRKICRFGSSCACHCSPFIQSVVSSDSVCRQWRPWSDCPDAQADLGPCYPHMPKDTFSHDTAHLVKYSQPSLYRHSIQRQNSLEWQFERHETFAQEVMVNEKLCNNIALKLQATYVLDIC